MLESSKNVATRHKAAYISMDVQTLLLSLLVNSQFLSACKICNISCQNNDNLLVELTSFYLTVVNWYPWRQSGCSKWSQETGDPGRRQDCGAGTTTSTNGEDPYRQRGL